MSRNDYSSSLRLSDPDLFWGKCVLPAGGAGAPLTPCGLCHSYRIYNTAFTIPHLQYRIYNPAFTIPHLQFFAPRPASLNPELEAMVAFTMVAFTMVAFTMVAFTMVIGPSPGAHLQYMGVAGCGTKEARTWKAAAERVCNATFAMYWQCGTRDA